MELNFSGKKVALVGGAGFIGHHLALRLKALGCQVEIIDAFSVNNVLTMYSSGALDQNKDLYDLFLKERIRLLQESSVEIRVANFADRFSAAKALEENYDVVYILAAVSHASRSNKDPGHAITNSVLPLINVANELLSRSNTRLVFLSSSTVYGNFKKDVVDEEDTCNPFGIYATIKYCGELLLKQMGDHGGLDFSVVRPTALYGERCISRRVSQIFLENAVAGVPSTFRGERDEKLDFTYIEDLVQGLVLSGFHEKARGEVFNITFGNARPVLRLIDILREHLSDVEINIEERDQATPIRGTLSNAKARALIGFSPEFDLETGYKRYIDWYSSFVDTSKVELSRKTQINE